MEHVRYPDGNVILRNLSREYPVISHGEGLYLFDTNGKRYIDASGGALVMSAGHGNKEIADRIHEQLSKVAYVNGTQFTSRVAEDLAARLARLSPDPQDLNRSCFLGSGSEAIEAAFKFARQLWVERKELGRSKFIARAPSYHGNTLFALSASARPHYKKYYGPMLHEVVVIPAPYEYRSEVALCSRRRRVLRQHSGSGNRAGRPRDNRRIYFRTDYRLSVGQHRLSPGYFDRIQKICKKHNILMIADEILCGSGRTGKFFACEHYGIKPDILLLGKGLSSGYIALSSVTVRKSHLQEMNPALATSCTRRRSCRHLRKLRQALRLWIILSAPMR